MKKTRIAIFAFTLLLALAGFGQTETITSEVDLVGLVSQAVDHDKVVIQASTTGNRYLKVLVYDYPEQKLEMDNKRLALQVKSSLLNTYPFLSDYRNLKVGFTSLKSVDSDYWNKKDASREEFSFSL